MNPSFRLMISAEHAIQRFRRDVTLGALVRLLLIGSALICLFVGPFVSSGIFDLRVLLFAIGMVWIVLSFRSVRGSQIAQSFPALIAAGQYDVVERQIDRSLRTFSLFKAAKVLTLHNLALLRHAQNRYRESAMLCRAVLGQTSASSVEPRTDSLRGVSKQSRLILADALLEMGDLPGSYDALVRLHNERLTLGEALRLLGIELDYLSRTGAWQHMLASFMTKVQLAELMPTANAARAEALLALAAKGAGRDDLCEWLKRRAELLVDPEEIVKDRPILRELWSSKLQVPHESCRPEGTREGSGPEGGG